jgi:hypothetical protein
MAVCLILKGRSKILRLFDMVGRTSEIAPALVLLYAGPGEAA